jgi:Ca2+-binding RTX toxin-like protein
MATYNLNHSGLHKLLDQTVSNGTEYVILQALLGADLVPKGHGTIGVETESVGGFYTVPSGDNFFLDTGLSNSMTLSSHGGVLIAAGDGGNTILDQGPGGDTLVGGAGADKLQVTQGDNVLIGGGFNTVGGGTGHDFTSGDATHFDGSNFDDGRGHGQGNGGGHWDDHGRGDDHGGGDDHKGQTFPSDTLIGGSGNDLFRVAHGDNWIYAGTGADTIYAGDGSDKIFGSTLPGATNAMDTIYLGTGDTSIQGGAGGAATIYAGMHGNDTITGSATGQTLDLYSKQSSHNVQSTSVSGGITTITFKDHQTLVLENVTIHYSK